MDAILYAEVYLICIIIAGILLYWTVRGESKSTAEIWLRRVLLLFLLNFLSNFLFTIFNRVLVLPALVTHLSYLFKTAYIITLAAGVFVWCGYAETTLHSSIFDIKKTRRLLMIPLALIIALALVNMRTHWIFYFDGNNAYHRRALFRVLLIVMFLGSGVCGWRLLRHARYESDPSQRSYMRLTATFPLCILLAWLLTYLGESVPVICVSVVVELLFLYIGTTNYQISLDKLTQVNNRQNLIGFLNYKLKNHEETLYLLMIDLDDFKTINDTYGHLEGDAALVRAATAIKRACGPFKKRPYIARYGGDEFIVVMEGDEREVAALTDSIRAWVRELGGQEKRYEIGLSIGWAQYRPGMDHKALIAAADEELYKIKRARVKA